MKKIFALLICFCLFAGVLTACAPADTGTAPAGSAAAGGGTAAPPDKEARKAALKAEFLKYIFSLPLRPPGSAAAFIKTPFYTALLQKNAYRRHKKRIFPLYFPVNNPSNRKKHRLCAKDAH